MNKFNIVGAILGFVIVLTKIVVSIAYLLVRA